IGEYYAQRRGIPPKNICHMRTSTDEEVPREVYDREIARPVAACLSRGQLTEQILYIATTSGVPLRVSGTMKTTDGDVAAVDSELALLYTDMKQGHPHVLKGGIPNPYFGKQTSVFNHAQFPIYLVTRLTAYDVARVKAMIDASLHAQNRGKFVI